MRRLHEFLKPSNLSTEALARAIGVSVQEMESLILNTRRLAPDEALRLAEYFYLDNDFWLNLQTAHDRWAARCEEKALPI